MRYLIIILTFIPIAADVRADVVEYDTEDRDQWFADVGGLVNVSTVDFTGYDDFTPVDDQWAHLGVHFSGFVVTSGPSDFIFPNDGWGLRGQPDINVTFDQPIKWIAADFPGVAEIELISDGHVIHTTQEFGAGGTGFFGGVISDEPFDAVRIFRTVVDVTFLDDLHFGPPIPAPASALPLALLLISRPRRVRSTHPCD